MFSKYFLWVGFPIGLVIDKGHIIHYNQYLGLPYVIEWE